MQGVGFRPFLYRLAEELQLAGWVRNDARGVDLEVEGPSAALAALRRRLGAEAPAAAVVQSIHEEALPWLGEAGFRIVASDAAAAKTAVILPDLATCADCRREVLDPQDRRHGYPFTNCTSCGPRFSILDELPYDRPRTTMGRFVMCPDCQREYTEPRDRRFHAQPNACPRCGPRLALLAADGATLGGDPLAGAVAALRRGEIVALKGLGGYQLLVDATNAAAVARLRQRKHRPAKPLALMVPDLAAARAIARPTAAEARLLASPQAPIVLLAPRRGAAVAPAVSSGAPRLGVMLPTTPLHHLLLAGFGGPLVATSGNLVDEPIAIDDADAVGRLGRIADRFLAHDRPIARHVDDSVAWVVGGAPQLLRRARGYAPLPVLLAAPMPTVLAVGAHQKNAVALAVGRQAFVSQHLGDLETPEARAAFERVIADFLRLYAVTPVAIAHDLHPDYFSSRWAASAAAAAGGLLARLGQASAPLERLGVQHHHAHLAACCAEHGAGGEVLGLTFDGTGWGPDGTVWGGEALLGDARSFRRLARLRPFRLPGGEAAVREPRRLALALLYELAGEAALGRHDLPALAGWSDAERATLAALLRGGLRSPWTSSAGRLFDGVAALLGLAPEGRVSFEGEAAVRLEALADRRERGSLPLPLVAAAAPPGLAPGQAASDDFWELDWRPLLATLLAEQARGTSPAVLAARFHNALATAAAELAARAGVARVALSGGCFQNRLLLRRTVARLRAGGHRVLLHRQVPANDGGIALGQLAVAAARLAA